MLGELAKAGNADPQAAMEKLNDTERQVHKASIDGDRKTLQMQLFLLQWQ